MNFEELLKFAVDQGASDVHFQAGSSPQLRLGGLIRNVEGPAIDGVSPAPVRRRRSLRRRSPRTWTGPSSAARGSRGAFEGLGRFRCSLYSQRGTAGLVMQLVPATIPTLEQLNLPPVAPRDRPDRGGLIRS